MSKLAFFVGEGKATAAQRTAGTAEVRVDAEEFGRVLGELASTGASHGETIGYSDMSAIAEARAAALFPHGFQASERHLFEEVARVGAIGGESAL